MSWVPLFWTLTEAGRGTTWLGLSIVFSSLPLSEERRSRVADWAMAFFRSMVPVVGP